ncbi:SRPBCC family protein [Luedemannella flava]|uniref:SRPBCC family protein n=1 Tax=Luedemannella flava TaxID=349316 RepID=A0ABN2LAU8_9ACTN
MAHTERTIAVPPDQVFAVLADGWTYADWVVGTTHIRDVDADWPAPGAKIHHKVGPWPVSLHDETVVLKADPPDRLVLRPRIRPFGELTVVFRLAPSGRDGTRVVLEEDIAKGPLRWVRNKLNDLLMHGRNKETLRRLADIAEHRPARRTGDEHQDSAGMARHA